MNARCVWAGRVRVKMIWIRGNGEKQPFEAKLGEQVQLADGKFTLETVRPEKMHNVTIKPSDYRLPFRIAGGLYISFSSSDLLEGNKCVRTCRSGGLLNH